MQRPSFLFGSIFFLRETLLWKSRETIRGMLSLADELIGKFLEKIEVRTSILIRKQPTGIFAFKAPVPVFLQVLRFVRHRR
jgi:hypothetical protein